MGSDEIHSHGTEIVIFLHVIERISNAGGSFSR